MKITDKDWLLGRTPEQLAEKERRRERQAESTAELKKATRNLFAPIDSRPREGGMLATAKGEGSVDHVKAINMARIPLSKWPKVFKDEDGDLATEVGKLCGVNATFENQDAHTAWTFTRIVRNSLCILFALPTVGLSLLAMSGRKNKGYCEIRLAYSNGHETAIEVDPRHLKQANRWIKAIREYNDAMVEAA